jgi:hypothetical protein
MSAEEASSKQEPRFTAFFHNSNLRSDNLDSVQRDCDAATHRGMKGEEQGGTHVQANEQKFLIDLLNSKDSQSTDVLILNLALEGLQVEHSKYSDEFLDSIKELARSVLSVQLPVPSIDESIYHTITR